MYIYIYIAHLRVALVSAIISSVSPSFELQTPLIPPFVAGNKNEKNFSRNSSFKHSMRVKFEVLKFQGFTIPCSYRIFGIQRLFNSTYYLDLFIRGAINIAEGFRFNSVKLSWTQSSILTESFIMKQEGSMNW